ncbi:hypothetical protein GCM10011497_06760 [Elstera cyanobacteriorum]|uniref:Uncharacterized protein n=1 Tax=Elstera cyanobacteriorum TaxID=2022747 RepID=A0A255XTH2_9PROT|nr:hypothetical protein [Elstera cyanobacteriorum]OYQ20212.1 hypothetical protein CHR90_05755 [Elstera cyanobacteriorum]GFZ80859.1 hypothetical protein GCM10011497_06760 [Elstera cyanobacteriorum]
MGAFPIDFLSAGQGVHPVGERIAAWVDPYPAKVLAARFAVSVKTAESWRAGHFPQMRHLLAMVEAWGEGFAAHVFAPVLGEAPLAHRLDRLARELTIIQGEVADGLSAVSAGAGLGPLPAGVAAQPPGASPSAARPALAGALSGRVAWAVLAAVLLWHGLDTSPDPHAMRPVAARLVKPAPVKTARGRLQSI